MAPLQTLPEPLMVPAGFAVPLMATGKLEEAPLPQVPVGITDTDPAVDPKVTVMLVVFAPAVMLAPVGTVQLYPVAPVTAAML